MSARSPTRPDAPGASVQNKVAPLTLLTLLLLLPPLLGVSYYALVAFERKLLPEIEKKALRVGFSINGGIQRALSFGIPFEKLEGMDDFFAAKLAAARDIAYVAVAARDGQPLYQQGPLDDRQRARLAADAAEVLATGATVGKFIPRHRLPAMLGTLLGDGADTPSPPAFSDGGDAYYRIALPIDAGNVIVGVLHLGIDARIVTRQIEAVLFDIAIVLLVAVLVAFEWLLLIAVSGIAEPLQQLDALLRRLGHGDFSRLLTVTARDRLGRLGHALNGLIERINARVRSPAPARTGAGADNRAATLPTGIIFASGPRPKSDRAPTLVPVRTAAFLFVFAEELARPFFPVYARALAAPVAGWSQEFLIGLSISIFMLVMALTMPVVGLWSNRIGHRNLFLLGALLSTVGLIGTGLAFSYWDLLVWRALSAFGYTLTFAACQGYVLDNTDSKNRTQGVATFTGGIVAADICGPAIGGILAERIGYGATFATGAALAVVAALVVARFIPHYIPRRRGHDGEIPSKRGAHLAELLRNPRFLVLMAFAAVPAKLLLTGFLFFLVPVLLTHLGVGQSEIGRIAMCYGIAAVVVMPLFARLTDRLNAPGCMVGVGCTLAGLGLMPVLFAPSPTTVWLAVVGLGVGQALSISAQVTLLALVCKDAMATHGTAPVMGVYRFIERLGSAAGPVVAVAFANAFGYAGAALALGIWGTVSATLFSVSFLILGATPEPEDAALTASP